MNSMDSTDVRRRKPRKARGTPLFKFRYYFFGAVAAWTLITGGLLIISPLSRGVLERAELFAAVKKFDLEDTTEAERLNNEAMLKLYNSMLINKKTRETYEEAVKPE